MTDTSAQSSSATPVITPQPISGTNSIDVASLLKDGMSSFKQGIQDAVGKVQGLLGSSSTSTSTAETATKAEADAETQIANVKATRDLQLKADNAANEASLGTLPGAASALAANIRDNVLPKQIQLQKDQDEIEGMKKVGLFDNPVQYAINSFMVPFKQKALSQEQADVDQRLGFSQKVQTLSDSTIAANNASDMVDATAMAKATSQEAFAQAAIKANEIQDRATALGISAANVSMQATTASMDVAFKYTGALFEQNKDVYERLQADANSAYKNAAASADAMRVKLESENDADKTSAFSAIQQSALAKTGMKIDNLQQFKLLSPNAQHTLTELAGNSTLTNGIDVLSPTKSMDMLISLGSNGPSPAVAGVFNKLRDVSAPVDTNPAWLTLKPEEKIPLKDQQIKQYVQQEAANIPLTGGIYSPLTFDKTANINPVISSLPLIKEMTAGGLGKDGKTPTNPDDFINSGLNQIKRGVPISDVATQISTTFQAVSTKLDNDRRYSLLNVPGLAPTQPYNMAVHVPDELRSMQGISSLPPILDMNNRAAVQNYLTRLAAAQRESAATGGVGFFVHQ